MLSRKLLFFASGLIVESIVRVLSEETCRLARVESASTSDFPAETSSVYTVKELLELYAGFNDVTIKQMKIIQGLEKWKVLEDDLPMTTVLYVWGVVRRKSDKNGEVLREIVYSDCFLSRLPAVLQ